jgi:TPR repeat protein
MKLEDIQLREAAKRGSPNACLTIAEHHFLGRSGFKKNYTLGLAYLQEELNRKSIAATLLVGKLLPLDVVVTQCLVPVLRNAADMGCSQGMLKLGTLQALDGDSRAEGIRWISASKLIDRALHDATFEGPSNAASFLKALTPEVVDKDKLAFWGARTALKDKDVSRACFFASLASHLMPFNPQIAEIVSLTVQLAANSDATVDLPTELVEFSLETRSAAGEVEAQYGLGCALGGLPYGQLQPQRIVRGANFDKATTLLLRAADAGKCRAWWDLSEMAPNHRSALPSKGMARFFLEKAAKSGIVQAQTKLGAVLLREATSLDSAEEGIRWLGLAAEQACMDADPVPGFRTIQ